MNADVATGAIVEARVRHIVSGKLLGDASVRPAVARAVVTFEADREGRRPFQKARVGRAVRLMATLATIGANRCMLENERAALVDMALEAGLLIGKGLFHHAGA